MAKILSLVFLGMCFLTLPLYCDEASTHQEKLAKLKDETAQKEKELKKYREQEKKISKEISALQTQKDRTEQLKNKLAADISVLEQKLLSTEDKRAALERSTPMWQGITLDELAAYYFTPSCPACPNGYSLEQEILINRMLTHKAVFTTELQKQTQEASQRIESFEARNQQLLAQRSQVKAEEDVISQSFNKKKKDLDATKRKADAVRKEINELNKSADELNKLLASFERKRNAQNTSKTSTTGKNKKYEGPKIDLPAHSLPWPVQGKVISAFGKEYRSDLNTWIFRDGIKISATQGETVKTVLSGSVIYAGPFRSYGNVVIVDHGKGIFTIYGFLKEIKAAVGDALPAQGVLGTAGKDTQSSSGTGQYAVYFEIRQGTTAVDPEYWLK